MPCYLAMSRVRVLFKIPNKVWVLGVTRRFIWGWPPMSARYGTGWQNGVIHILRLTPMRLSFPAVKRGGPFLSFVFSKDD